MTIFAVICAGIYPGIHVGRFWYAWFMFPLPNANHIFQNFRSALLWDLFAVSHVLHDLADLLVHRPHPGPRHAPRPGEEPLAAGDLRFPVARAGAAARGTGGTTKSRT